MNQMATDDFGFGRILRQNLLADVAHELRAAHRYSGKPAPSSMMYPLEKRDRSTLRPNASFESVD